MQFTYSQSPYSHPGLPNFTRPACGKGAGGGHNVGIAVVLDLLRVPGLAEILPDLESLRAVLLETTVPRQGPIILARSEMNRSTHAMQHVQHLRRRRRTPEHHILLPLNRKS